MKGKVVLLNFGLRGARRMRKALEESGRVPEIEEAGRPSDLEKVEGPLACVFYLSERKSDLEQAVREIRQGAGNVPLNVLFKKRDFEGLMQAFELPLSSVLPEGMSKEKLQSVLDKCELRTLGSASERLPVKQLLEFMSTSVKVRTDRDLHRRLYSYFKSFPESPDFALYRAGKNKAPDSFELVEGSRFEGKDIFKAASEFVLPKIFIGKNVKTAGKEGKTDFAFPVYEQEGEETWCFCSVEEESSEKILNDFFFRHLENILIFRKNVSRAQEYMDLANKDDVTGLYNQRKLAKDLEETIAIHQETNETFSIMFIDVDHFKKVNDNFGHIVGSRMLTEIGKELTDVLRSSDKIYRYGGDEFVVLMPKVNIQTVHKIAVRVREAVKKKTFNVGTGDGYQLSLSIGIAEYPTDAKTAEEIVNFADSMMYVSKKSGRGKVFHVGEVDDDIVGAE